LEWTRRDFREYDVEADPAANARMTNLNGGTHNVPVLVEDGKVIQVGWQGRSCIVGTGAEAGKWNWLISSLLRNVASSLTQFEWADAGVLHFADQLERRHISHGSHSHIPTQIRSQRDSHTSDCERPDSDQQPFKVLHSISVCKHSLDVRNFGPGCRGPDWTTVVHLRFSEYFQQEAVGTRMRWWDRSLRDFLLLYLRSAIGWVTGMEIISDEVQRRNSDTLTDMLNTPGVSPDSRSGKVESLYSLA
jgi:hypothetical protein